MAQAQAVTVEDTAVKKKVALGLWAVFVTYFIVYFFNNSINIAQPNQVTDLDGMALFSWIVALPALSGAVATLLGGKLSDMYGRRAILIVTLVLFLVGSVLSALSTTMTFAIVSRVILMLGLGALSPLCFSVIGDIFEPAARARWSGMMNVPAGIAATIAPTLGGFITDSPAGWRGLFWVFVPLILIAGAVVAVGVPGRKEKTDQKVDILGIIVMVVASATLIIGVSWLGDPTKLTLGIILTVVSIAAWVWFVSIEKKAEAPILDPEVLFNRVFFTAAFAGFMSFFGLLGVMIYSPVFAQEVMKVSPTVSGSMLTPFSMLFAFMGVPAGFALAKTKRYKWIFISGYAILSVAMFIMWQFTADTPVWLFVLATALVGFANGVMPTINTLVAQFAVPKRLLGVAVGAIFFVVMMGMAISPAILGLAQNSAATLEGGLKLVFLVGAIGMVVSFLMVLTIPEVSIDGGEEAPQPPAEA